MNRKNMKINDGNFQDRISKQDTKKIIKKIKEAKRLKKNIKSK